MAIPKHILDDCKIFCDKLQELVDIMTLNNFTTDDDAIITYKENVKKLFVKNGEFDENALKTFLGNIISSFLKSKRLYDNSHAAFYEKNIAQFYSLINEYHRLRLQNEPHYQSSSFRVNNIYDYISYRFSEIEGVKQQFKHYNLKWLLSVNETCSKLYLWLLDYEKFVNQPNAIAFNHTILPFALKYLSISDFQCIKHIEAQLPVDAQFIVFTGENGDGKTSILQALGLGLYNTKDLRDNEKGNTETVITVQYKADENSYHNEIYNNTNFPTLYSLRNNIRELKSFAAYGASRLQLESVESADNQKLLRSPIFNLFYSNAILQNIERWLRTRLLKGETEKYNSVIELLVKLLPNVTAIEREDTIDDVIFVYTEKGIKIPVEHLSSGHKSIVAMVGDMVIRLSSAQPEITNPKDFAGIVLIDELETHLHPKWQKEFPKILAETFPKVQFIVTTHSAITLLGMPKNTVFFKVTRTEEEGTQIERLEIDVENLTPNLLLSSPIFGLQDIFSVQNKGMENVHTGDFFDEKDTRQQAKDKIRALYKQLKDKENNEKSN